MDLCSPDFSGKGREKVTKSFRLYLMLWRRHDTQQTLSMMPYSIMTFTLKGFIVTLSISQSAYTTLSIAMQVRVNQRLHFPLSATCFPLLSDFHSMSIFRPNDYISVGVTLACYQEVGSGGKYVDVSGKWSCWFTLTLAMLCHYA
jgi:hypothetical protein